MSEQSASPSEKDPGEGAQRPAHARDASGLPRVVTSESLLAGALQLAILHNQTIYFLRQTRFGKLILTK